MSNNYDEGPVLGRNSQKKKKGPTEWTEMSSSLAGARSKIDAVEADEGPVLGRKTITGAVTDTNLKSISPNSGKPLSGPVATAGASAATASPETPRYAPQYSKRIFQGARAQTVKQGPVTDIPEGIYMSDPRYLQTLKPAEKRARLAEESKSLGELEGDQYTPPPSERNSIGNEFFEKSKTLRYAAPFDIGPDVNDELYDPEGKQEGTARFFRGLSGGAYGPAPVTAEEQIMELPGTLIGMGLGGAGISRAVAPAFGLIEGAQTTLTALQYARRIRALNATVQAGLGAGHSIIQESARQRQTGQYDPSRIGKAGTVGGVAGGVGGAMIKPGASLAQNVAESFIGGGAGSLGGEFAGTAIFGGIPMTREGRARALNEAIGQAGENALTSAIMTGVLHQGAPFGKKTGPIPTDNLQTGRLSVPGETGTLPNRGTGELFGGVPTPEKPLPGEGLLGEYFQGRSRQELTAARQELIARRGTSEAMPQDERAIAAIDIAMQTAPEKPAAEYLTSPIGGNRPIGPGVTSGKNRWFNEGFGTKEMTQPLGSERPMRQTGEQTANTNRMPGSEPPDTDIYKTGKLEQPDIQGGRQLSKKSTLESGPLVPPASKGGPLGYKGAPTAELEPRTTNPEIEPPEISNKRPAQFPVTRQEPTSNLRPRPDLDPNYEGAGGGKTNKMPQEYPGSLPGLMSKKDQFWGLFQTLSPQEQNQVLSDPMFPNRFNIGSPKANPPMLEDVLSRWPEMGPNERAQYSQAFQNLADRMPSSRSPKTLGKNIEEFPALAANRRDIAALTGENVRPGEAQEGFLRETAKKRGELPRELESQRRAFEAGEETKAERKAAAMSEKGKDVRYNNRIAAANQIASRYKTEEEFVRAAQALLKNPTTKEARDFEAAIRMIGGAEVRRPEGSGIRKDARSLGALYKAARDTNIKNPVELHKLKDILEAVPDKPGSLKPEERVKRGRPPQAKETTNEGQSATRKGPVAEPESAAVSGTEKPAESTPVLPPKARRQQPASTSQPGAGQKPEGANAEPEGVAAKLQGSGKSASGGSGVAGKTSEPTPGLGKEVAPGIKIGDKVKWDGKEVTVTGRHPNKYDYLEITETVKGKQIERVVPRKFIEPIKPTETPGKRKGFFEDEGGWIDNPFAEPDPREKNNVAATSVKQTPALFRAIKWIKDQVNIDIGGGRFDDGTNYLRDTHGVESHVLDPFNRSEEHNNAVIERFKKKPADTATVANVLNVIEDPQIRADVIRDAGKYVKDGGKIYFSTYEGNGSGKGAKTKTGSWQENRRTASYLKEVQKFYPDAKVSKGVIEATNTRINPESGFILNPFAKKPKTPLQEKIEKVHTEHLATKERQGWVETTSAYIKMNLLGLTTPIKNVASSAVSFAGNESILRPGAALADRAMGGEKTVEGINLKAASRAVGAGLNVGPLQKIFGKSMSEGPESGTGLSNMWSMFKKAEYPQFELNRYKGWAQNEAEIASNLPAGAKHKARDLMDKRLERLGFTEDEVIRYRRHQALDNALLEEGVTDPKERDEGIRKLWTMDPANVGDNWLKKKMSGWSNFLSSRWVGASEQPMRVVGMTRSQHEQVSLQAENLFKNKLITDKEAHKDVMFKAIDTRMNGGRVRDPQTGQINHAIERNADAIIAGSIKDAEDLTFANSNWFSNWVARAKKGGFNPGDKAGLGEYVIKKTGAVILDQSTPFPKANSNIWNKILEMTPGVGAITQGSDILYRMGENMRNPDIIAKTQGRGYTDLFKESFTKSEKRYLAMAAAKQGAGAAILAGFTMLMDRDFLSRYIPFSEFSDQDRDDFLLEQAARRKPGSVYVPVINDWVPLDSFGPYGNLGYLAAVYQEQKKSNPTSNFIVNYMRAVGSRKGAEALVFQQPGMEGARSLAASAFKEGSTDSPGERLAEGGAKLVAGLVPKPVQLLAENTDLTTENGSIRRVERQPEKFSKDFWGGFWDNLAVKFPGARQTVAEKVDAMGSTVTKDVGLIDTLFSGEGGEKMDKVFKLFRENNIGINKPRRKEGQTNEEYAQQLKDDGIVYAKFLKDFANSPVIDHIQDFPQFKLTKGDIIEKMSKDAKEKARKGEPLDIGKAYSKIIRDAAHDKAEADMEATLKAIPDPDKRAKALEGFKLRDKDERRKFAMRKYLESQK